MNKCLLLVLIFTLLQIAFLVPKKPSRTNEATASPIQKLQLSSLPVEPPSSPVPPKQRFSDPIFVIISEHRKVNESGSVYADVIGHSKGAPFGDRGGRSTNVHETAHGIHSELRNEFTRKAGKRVNGFYCLQGRGAIVEEPGITMSVVKNFVPQNLRSYRWKLYMEQQLRAWNDTPLYIYDEWVAYVLGGCCGVDDVKNGRHRDGWSDTVSGCLDFSIYAVGLAMAVKQHDRAYWETNTQFRDFTYFMLRLANQTYLEGHQMKQFAWKDQDDLLQQLLFSENAEPMRRFLREEFDGVWLDFSYRSLYFNHVFDVKPCSLIRE